MPIPTGRHLSRQLTYLCGILLQAWYCFGRKRPEFRQLALWPQVVTGIAYGAVGVVFGGAYMS